MKKKKTVTLPRVFNPGKGHPKETLAYLNPAEHALIKQLTDGKANRGPMGVRSYAVETGTTTNSSSGGGSTTGGGGSKGPNGGPGGGSLQAPARTAPSANVNSGVIGSKGGGASTQKPGAGENAGPADVKTVAKAAQSLKDTRTTALGNVASAAQANASRAPNAAAQAAYDKAKMNAMNQRNNPVTRGEVSPAGLRPGAMAGDFVHSALGYNVNRMDQLGITDANRIVDGFNNLKQFKDVAYDPAGVQKIRDSLGYTPVGIRTNNPGNILDSSWQKAMPGYAGPVKSPNGLTYSSYTDPRWGLAAQNELLGRYSDMGRNTINSVVDRYAPVDQNNSAAANAAYKQSLSNATGWGANDPLTREQVQSLGPYKTAFENGGVAFAGGPFGGTPTIAGGTQVAGIANAGLSAAKDLDRAKKAAEAAAAMQRLGPVQGPNMPPQAIPAPNSIGILGSSYSGYGNFNPPHIASQAPTPRPAAGTYTSPYDIQPASAPPRNPSGGMSYTPDLPGPMPAQTSVVTDPRVALTPLGSLPAAKPKDVQVAWNVPPMGGAVPSAYGDLFGTWGVNRPQPKGPAANPGTIHSQTADVTPPATGWKDWVKQKTGVDVQNAVETVQKKVDEAKPMLKFAQEHPTLAQIGLKMMMGGGGNMPGNLGTAQENSDWYMKPQPPQAPVAPQMADASSEAMSALQSLQQLQANMVAQGASPEDLAYIQSIIDELTNTQVA